MASPSWDPDQYQRFAAERERPFADLVAQIPTGDPRDVVDLGCGPGTMTATLADRWPRASVTGLDSSPEMVAAAAALSRPGRLAFAAGDVRTWQPRPDSYDVIVCNAVLQWVPDHLDLLPGWARALRSGGALAVQVPAAGGAAATTVFRTVAGTPRWAGRLSGVGLHRGPRGRSPVREPDAYLDALARPGFDVNAWESTYLHVLPGDDPVLEWFAGTGLRPYLDALAGDPSALADFRAEVAAGLREAYPRRPYGTVLPFRRVFVVAVRQ